MDTNVPTAASFRLRQAQQRLSTFATGSPTSSSGYPWQDGSMLYAPDLNAAIANAAVIGGALLTTGGTMTGRLVLSDSGNAISDRAVQNFGDGRYLQLATGGTLGGALTLAADPTAPLQPVTLQYLQNTSGFPLMTTPQPAGGFTSSPFPFGNMNECTAFSAQIVPPDALGRPTWPQVGGYWHLYNMAGNNDGGGGSCVLYAGADSRAPTTITVASATYTATTMVPSVALTLSQVSFIQQAIAINNQRAASIPAGMDNIGMLINTAHSPLYVGSITGVAADGSSITVLGWYQLGNTAAGQIPPGTAGATINPATHMWCMNGVMSLQAGTAVNGMTYLEADCYNYQSAFTGTGPSNFLGISVNGNGPNAGAYGVVALNNWYAGFLAQGNTTYGYLCQGGQSSSNNPAFGFVSQVPSNVSGGHHPFAYYDFALAAPQYRWSVTSNGSINCGAPAYDNGFQIAVGAPGNPAVLNMLGPDTDITLRLATKGAGLIDCGGDIQRNANPAGSIPAAVGGITPRLNIQGTDGGIPAIQITSYAQRSGIYLRRGDTGRAGTTALVNNDNIGALYASGFDGSVWSSYAAGVVISAGGAWSATAHPTFISLLTTPTSSTTTYERLRVFPSGNVVISQTTGAFPSDDGINALQVWGGITALNFPTVASNANPAAIPAPGGAWTPSFNLQGNDGAIPALQITSYAQRTAIIMRRSDGTGASPTGLVNNDLIGAIYAAGYDTSVWSGQAAGITLSAGGTWSPTSHPTFVSLATTPTASTVMYERVRVYPSGNVAISQTTGTFPTDDGVNALQIAGSIRVGAAGTGPTWTSGAGVPASTQPVGSIYSNTSGAAGARLYVSAGGGTWTAIASV